MAYFPGDVTADNIIGRKAIILPNNVIIITNNGTPVQNITGANVAGRGSICIDYAAGNLYVNRGRISAPAWERITTVPVA